MALAVRTLLDYPEAPIQKDHTLPPKISPETLAAQAAGDVDAETGGVVLPVHITTTYERDPDNGYRRGYSYARSDNATVRQTEKIVAGLECGKAALLYGSGMAAATALLLSLERPAHIVAPRVMYWALRKWLGEDAKAFGLEATFVDVPTPQNIAAAIVPGLTRMVWLETPANPLWTIADIEATARVAHDAGALMAVDSTVATPVLTQPLKLGADVVMHSATKYLNGHSDVVAGALVFPEENALHERALRQRNTLGAILGPFEAAMLQRGLRTLYVRVRQQCATALAIAEHFARHENVSDVLYPGLANHPGHGIAARQMKGGFGGMLSVRVQGGEKAAIATAADLKLWKRATSLGGTESLIEHRASVEGPTSPCPPDLLRLSVGLEAPMDLIADLDQALSAAHAA
ncbi:MAG: hypothetical protein RLZ98_1415 [Pseudomonadota bacterium]